jgi:hypothetical protein
VIPNVLFYDKLLIDETDESLRPSIIENLAPVTFVDIPGTCEFRNKSYINVLEIRSIVDFISRAVQIPSFRKSSCGIVTLYKSQAEELAQKVDEIVEKVADESDSLHIPVRTVDSFQGGEKDLILISCCRTDFVGFTDSPRRLNVALSRARNHVILFGHKKTLSKSKLWFKIIEMSHCIEFAQLLKLVCPSISGNASKDPSLPYENLSSADQSLMPEKLKAKKRRMQLPPRCSSERSESFAEHETSHDLSESSIQVQDDQTVEIMTTASLANYSVDQLDFFVSNDDCLDLDF